MHKILLICKREYLTRVKKKSFLVMTLLSPLLMVLFYGFIFYFSANRDLGEDKKSVLLNDQTKLFAPQLSDNKSISFIKNYPGKEAADQMLKNETVFAILDIEQNGDTLEYKLTSLQQPGLGTVSSLESSLLEILKQKKMQEKGISENLLQELNNLDVNISTLKTTGDKTEKSNTGLTTLIGFAGAIMVYFFIFIYGVQVMKGVIEEKTNRIVEVIISSVKPFELMAGKIMGIAMVGFTQFIIWVLLVFVLSGPVSGLVMNLTHTPEAATAATTAGEQASGFSAVTPILESISALNIPFLLAMFLFYFLGGYLFYGALFAAIGSAVDNETDTQQFMMPVTIPLVFSIALAQSAINNPESALAFWLSVIPFSSPVIMMVRIPFGVPASEIIISMLSLIAGIVGTVWLAGRIYRIGILTFGKKPTYRELAKWLFRKN